MKCKHCNVRLAIYGPEGRETTCHVCREIQLAENRRDADPVEHDFGRGAYSAFGGPASRALGEIIKAESWARHCLTY